MPDDGVVQLRRNASKQLLARPFGNRHAKASKGPNSRSSKLIGGTGRKNLGALTRSNSGSSLNQASNSYGIELEDVIQCRSPKSSGPILRLNRGSSAASIGVSNAISSGLHQYMGLSGGLRNLAQGHRKPVIQLEQDEDDDEDEDENKDEDENGNGNGNGDDDEVDPESTEYEDFEEDEDNSAEALRPPMADRSDSQLSIGIRPVEPTPPKLSEETVISVSSVADMASALKGARDKSGFVGNDDLISTAVNRSKNLGNMAQMVRGWNSATQRQSAHTQSRKSSALEIPRRNSAASIGGEDPREYEKVFREYTNSRAINNPVVSSLYRISLKNLPAADISKTYTSNSVDYHDDYNSIAPPRLQFPPVKKVNSLVATTANQMSDYSERSAHRPFSAMYASPQSQGATESISAYTLNKIWQTGWVNPDDPAMASRISEPKSRNLQEQAMRAQQQLSSNRSQPHGSTARLVIQ